MELVFPWVEKQREDGVDCIAGVHFLDLLKYLRIVCLQDSVFWKKAYPSLPMFRHALFQLPEYKEFAERLDAASQVAENPAHASIHQLAPVIADAINTGIASITTGLAAQQTATEQLRREIVVQANRQTTRVLLAFQESHAAAAHVFADHIQAEHGQTEIPGPSDVVPAASVETDTGLSPTPTAGSNKSVSYTLRRDLLSIAEVWQEYETGFAPGLAVRDLEARY